MERLRVAPKAIDDVRMARTEVSRELVSALANFVTSDRQKASEIALLFKAENGLCRFKVLCLDGQRYASSITYRCPSAQVANPQDDSIFHPRAWHRAARLEVSFHRLLRA